MKKHISKLIIGIPIVLLLIALALSNREHKTYALSEGFNSYLKPIPSDYETALIANTEVNDSIFFPSTLEDFAIRKLLIFKTFPDENEVKTDFTIELYPTNKALLKDNKAFLTFEIVNDAVLFNHKKKTYGVFKLPLPLIDIEKLVIKNKIKRKIDKPWESVLLSPFKPLDELKTLSNVKQNDIEKKPTLFTSLFTKQLKKYEIKYLPSYLEANNNKVSRFYESIDDFMLTNKASLVKITRPKGFWNKFNKKDKTLLKQIEFTGERSKEAEALFDKYLNEDLAFELVFDIDKLALYNALKPIFSEDCPAAAYFIFNEGNGVLEPFHTTSNCPKEKTLTYLKASEIKDQNYLQVYASAVDEVSQIDLKATLIKDNIEFKNEMALINNKDPKHVFDFDLIRANQRALSKSLNPSTALKSELISIDKNRMILSVFNTSNYAIDILELSHKNKKTITKLNPGIQIASNVKDTIVINLPRSFENLFVSKKKKVVGFILPRHIYELNMKYRISGVNKTYASSIIPYQKMDEVDDDLFRTPAYINNHKNIVVDDGKKEISFSKDSVVVSAPLVIQKNYTFKLKPGTIVNIIEGGKIISHAPLRFIGTAENPIKVYSSDQRGQGLLVLSEQRQSTLKHVVFDQLRNPTHGSWGVTGAVTFYESPVDLEFVAVKNNKCEDALNIVRAKFTMNQVAISNTQSDAFDGDFVKGTISNCQFDYLGNDAIDVSGSDLIIRNVIISNAGDKGLSAGENSKMTIDTVEISNSEIAVAGKDLSVVDAKNLKISNTKLGFTAFQKKPEFGPSKITVNGILMTGIETKYLIESSSSLFVDNQKIETTQNVKDRMYGVEFGRSSAETRNTPQ
ncbi:right-handed parallel beta-helix repeat-containing protein [uncultured Psychroserpens sp.]|uniref:right-handed parallel beta-helix repeat-containing protein n=1 Tax=uncultured Psychroserpens sp. TaxID=255436 RepID=UPI00262CE942|nr:right-handed parallel beta-helix repeat-containing protein [uncultured Psychroserpens sp.]